MNVLQRALCRRNPNRGVIFALKVARKNTSAKFLGCHTSIRWGSERRKKVAQKRGGETLGFYSTRLSFFLERELFPI